MLQAKSNNYVSKSNQNLDHHLSCQAVRLILYLKFCSGRMLKDLRLEGPVLGFEGPVLGLEGPVLGLEASALRFWLDYTHCSYQPNNT